MDTVRETEKNESGAEDGRQTTKTFDHKSITTSSMTSQALGGSKIGSGVTDLPTITGRRPLARALLPRDQRRASAAYQPVIGSSLAFLGAGLGASKPASTASQRRSSISTYYPLRPGMSTSSRLGSTLNRSRAAVMADGVTPASENGKDLPGTQRDMTSYRRGSLSTELTSPTLRRPLVVEESIYPLLRSAFSKDHDEIEEREMARLKIVTGRKLPERPVSANIESLSGEHASLGDRVEACSKDVRQDGGLSPSTDDHSAAVIRSPRFIGLTKALANQDSSQIANKMQKLREASSVSGKFPSSRSPAVPVKVISPWSASSSSTVGPENGTPGPEGIPGQASPLRDQSEPSSDSGLDDTLNTSLRSVNRSGQSTGSGADDSWYEPIPSTPRRTIATPKPSLTTPSTANASDTPYSNFFENFNASTEAGCSSSVATAVNGRDFVVEFGVSSVGPIKVKSTSSSLSLSNTETNLRNDKACTDGEISELKPIMHTVASEFVTSFSPTVKLMSQPQQNESHQPETQHLDAEESEPQHRATSYLPPPRDDVNNNSSLANVSHLEASSPPPCLPNASPPPSLPSAPPPPLPSSAQPALIGQNSSDVSMTEWSLLGDDDDVISPIRGHQHRTTDSINTEDSGMGDRSSDAGLTGTDGCSDAGADSVGHDGAQYTSDEEAESDNMSGKNVGVTKRMIDSSSEGRGSMCSSPPLRTVAGLTALSAGEVGATNLETAAASENSSEASVHLVNQTELVSSESSLNVTSAAKQSPYRAVSAASEQLGTSGVAAGSESNTADIQSESIARDDSSVIYGDKQETVSCGKSGIDVNEMNVPDASISSECNKISLDKNLVKNESPATAEIEFTTSHSKGELTAPVAAAATETSATETAATEAAAAETTTADAAVTMEAEAVAEKATTAEEAAVAEIITVTAEAAEDAETGTVGLTAAAEAAETTESDPVSEIKLPVAPAELTVEAKGTSEEITAATTAIAAAETAVEAPEVAIAEKSAAVKTESASETADKAAAVDSALEEAGDGPSDKIIDSSTLPDDLKKKQNVATIVELKEAKLVAETEVIDSIGEPEIKPNEEAKVEAEIVRTAENEEDGEVIKRTGRTGIVTDSVVGESDDREGLSGAGVSETVAKTRPEISASGTEINKDLITRPAAFVAEKLTENVKEEELINTETAAEDTSESLPISATVDDRTATRLNNSKQNLSTGSLNSSETRTSVPEKENGSSAFSAAEKSSKLALRASKTSVLSVEASSLSTSGGSTSGTGEPLTVVIQKGHLGLGFCVEGGMGSAMGDRPISVKRIFKGHPTVQEVLRPGDVILQANGRDLASSSQYDAWNFLKSLPEGVVTLQIQRP